MPCIHGIAAIRKKRGKPEDYVHPWLCMDSIHATFKHSIHPVPSEQYWSNQNYLKTEAPIIKRPITRPKGYNYKTYKGPSANLGWKPRTSRKKKTTGGSTSNTSQVEVPLSQQSAPAPEDAPPLVISAPVPYAPFKPPAQINDAQPSKRLLRAKQPIRRNTGRSSPPSIKTTNSISNKCKFKSGRSFSWYHGCVLQVLEPRGS
ncbi:hypothetical protein PIB30_057107 [Stylosanthes scabra]|uniref:Uncharacterized protein n=1 Tax=Stylosanthes scabra TaxID=79078 RepID=A0ABU6XJU3_9FABA|nr:hypothetical protein [Stylosanthes scabra]